MDRYVRIYTDTIGCIIQYINPYILFVPLGANTS